MNVQEFVNDNGKIARLNEANGRIVTMAYRRNLAEGTITYGATIFRPSDPSGERGESFNRKSHNETAVRRAVKCPVTIPDSDMSGRERRGYIRRSMYANGCSLRPGKG